MAAEQVTEQIAEGLEEAAQVTRRIDTKSVGFFLGGLGVGVAIGFYFGYRWNKEKIRSEAFAQSEEEVQKIREVYRQSNTVEKEQQKKPSLKAVIEERGYSVDADAVTDDVIMKTEMKRPLRPPVPVAEPPTRTPAHTVGTSAPFMKRTEDAEKDKNDGWSYPYELSRRSPNTPYIIHQDEFALNESGYSQVSYIYYEVDDVLTDEDNTIIYNRENLVGDNFRWGHGSDDLNILYIRNSELEIEFEICRTPTPRSFEEEVLGLEPNDEEN